MDNIKNFPPLPLSSSPQKTQRHQPACKNPHIWCPGSLNCCRLHLLYWKNFCFGRWIPQFQNFFIQNINNFLHFLQELSKPLPFWVLLVDIDFVSLYAIIPNTNALAAVANILSCRLQSSFLVTNFQIAFTQFVLTNNVSFNNNIYLQISGTVMGTRMAPSYANLWDNWNRVT